MIHPQAPAGGGGRGGFVIPGTLDTGGFPGDLPSPWSARWRSRFFYPSGVSATDSPPNWGRGTTDEDKAKKNTTVGFYESCHVADYKHWLKSKPLPSFGGKLRMTKREYDKACDQFNGDWNDYFKAAEKDSEDRTDETGVKKSVFLASR